VTLNKWYLNPLKYFSVYCDVLRKSVIIIISMYIDRLLCIISQLMRMNNQFLLAILCGLSEIQKTCIFNM
jgi:hypothetical protein